MNEALLKSLEELVKTETKTTMAEYLRKKHPDLSVEVRNLVQDTVSAINFTLPGVERENLAKKQMFINHALNGMGFEDFELEAFAQDRVPVGTMTIPVNVELTRNYRIYVDATEDMDAAAVMEQAKKYIAEHGLGDAELDVELDSLICHDPCYEPSFDMDWDGAMYD